MPWRGRRRPALSSHRATTSRAGPASPRTWPAESAGDRKGSIPCSITSVVENELARIEEGPQEILVALELPAAGFGEKRQQPTRLLGCGFARERAQEQRLQPVSVVFRHRQ